MGSTSKQKGGYRADRQLTGCCHAQCGLDRNWPSLDPKMAGMSVMKRHTETAHRDTETHDLHGDRVF